MSTNISLRFSWDPPAPIANVGAPTQYIVRCEPQLEGIDPPALVNQSALQETATVTDLFPGVTYDCSVTAMNNREEGDPAEESGTTQERGRYMMYLCSRVIITIVTCELDKLCMGILTLLDKSGTLPTVNYSSSQKKLFPYTVTVMEQTPNIASIILLC